MNDMTDAQGYRRSGGMVSMAEFGREGLIEAMADDREIAPGLGDAELFAQIEALPDDLPVFVRNVLRYENRIQAALATWWGEYRNQWASWDDDRMDEVSRVADETMRHPGVRAVLKRSEVLRGCPSCTARRSPRIGFGKVFWECEPCNQARQDASCAAWLCEVDRDWSARALDMLGEVHWPTSHPTHESVQAVLSKAHCGAYLHGAPGTGKTQQAAEFVRHILAAYRSLLTPKVAESYQYTQAPFPSVLSVSEVDVLASLRGGRSNPPRHTIERYTKARYLAIDDLGTVKGTDFSYAAMYQIVNERYTQRLPTVFTSNYSLPELRGRGLYDERITQRIFDMCGGKEAHRAGELGVVELVECYRMPAGEEVLW